MLETWKGMWGLTLLLLMGGGVRGHVQLSYPPPTLRIDFLDNLRSGGLCGHAPSGRQNSDFWKLPEPSVDTTTDLVAGSKVTVSWDLHYAHQGGFLFELYNSDLDLVSTWNDTDHWQCSYDGTQQSIDLVMPTKTCNSCILRLVRQALEWGRNYRFHNCAQVNIVKKGVDSPNCNGCSGHGTCRAGECECDSNEDDGFWYGKYCERQNECEKDSHCGGQGECIDTKALTAPRKQCYCKSGFFGKEIVRGSTTADLISTRRCNKKSKLTLGSPEDWDSEYPHKLRAGDTMTLYYKVDEESKEIEFAVTAKTTNWVSFGFRASGIKGAAPRAAEPSEGGDGEGEAAADGEGGYGKRKMLNSMPVLEKEAFEHQRGLMQQDDEGAGYGGGGDEGEGEGEGEGEAEGEGEGTAVQTCPDGGDPVTTEEDAGVHLKKPVESTLTLGGGGTDGGADAEGEGEGEAAAEGSGRRRLAGMPRLLIERADSVAAMGRELLEDGEGEGEGEGESEGEDTGKKTKTVKTLFAEGSKCENVLVDSPTAHPMISQDLIIAYARGTSIRVQDSFTPSRARPSPDIFFGGEDDIVDAVGEETDDGYSNFKVRRKLETNDQAGDYCILEDVNYFVIYAIGQGENPSHTPDSSLEAGRASNKKFYGEDELKYHGGGIGVTFPGRGSFGVLNFFDEPTAEGACLPSTSEDFECMVSLLAGAYTLHWKAEADGVKFGAESTGTGWVAVGFPETPGQMVGSDAVLGWVEDGDATVDLFKLEQKASSGITAGNNAFDVQDASVEATDTGTFLTFTREFDDTFTADGPVDLVVALNPSAGPGFVNHGPTNRVPTTIDLAAVPSNNVCTPSNSDAFDCATEQLGGTMMVNWKREEEGVKMSLEVEGTGYVSVAWPETPGMMVPATAVIAWVDEDGTADVGVYDMTAKVAAGIIPSEAFEITDTEIVQENGKTTLTFTRPFDTGNRRKLLFTEDSGPTDLLFARHDTARGLEHHTTREGGSVNFKQTPAVNAGPTAANSVRATRPESRLSEETLSDGGCMPSNLDGYECMLQTADDMIFHWTATSEEVRMAGQSTAQGFVSIGFPESPGQMVPAMAVLGFAGANANVDMYDLGGKSEAAVVAAPNGLPSVTDMEVEEIEGTTVVSFTRQFDEEFPYEDTHNLIYAYHTEDAVMYHGVGSRNSVDLNFAKGEATANEAEDLTRYWQAHGWLMVISWGGLLPIGIIIARTMKDKAPIWFYIHVTCQTVGIVVAVVAWAIALAKFDPPQGFRHGRVGMAVMIMGLLQANAFLRPHPGDRFRHGWEWLHWSLGRAALILGIYNIFTGLDRYDVLKGAGQKYHVNYGMFLLSMFVVYLNLEARSQRLKKEKAEIDLNARLKGVDVGSSAVTPPAASRELELHHRGHGNV